MQADLAVAPISETAPIKRPLPIAAENLEKKEIIKTEITPPVKKNDNDQLQQLQRSLAEQNIALRFSKDADTKILIVEMVDSVTGEAILQLPSKVSLKLAAESAKLQGLFINKTI